MQNDGMDGSKVNICSLICELILKLFNMEGGIYRSIPFHSVPVSLHI